MACYTKIIQYDENNVTHLKIMLNADPALPMVGLLGRIRCPTRRWEEDDRSRASIRPFGNLVGASCPAGGACRIAGRDPRWRSAPDLDSFRTSGRRARALSGRSWRCARRSRRALAAQWDRLPDRHFRAGATRGTGGRSEEHTSELQSLMRISYAVFCLKKKIRKLNDNY